MKRRLIMAVQVGTRCLSNPVLVFPLTVLLIAGFAFDCQAAPVVSLGDPTPFFTNVAGRLLQRQLGVDLSQLEIYPTNRYTPAVHRLLQLTANVYDAATNRSYGFADVTNGFPSVFRPLFRRADDGRVLIVSYREVTNADMAVSATAPALADLDSGQNTNAIPALGIPFDPVDKNEPMVAGIPLIIGVRKGFPNFNQFSFDTAVQVARRLEFIKMSPIGPVVQTNQMYLLSISNAFGLEAWNSYTNAYPRDLQMSVVLDLTSSVTDENGQLVLSNNAPWSNYVAAAVLTNVTGGVWNGFPISPVLARYSFLVPFSPPSNWYWSLPPASYSSLQGSFVTPPQQSFERGLDFPVPRWWLVLRQRLRFMLVDVAANRIVDYVNLVSSHQPLDLTTAFTSGGVIGQPYRPDCHPGSMWDPDRSGGSTNIAFPTYGVLNQIQASLGTNMTGLVWSAVNDGFPAGWDRIAAQNFFRTNLLHWPPLPGQFIGPQYLTNLFYAPYTASRLICVNTSWMANDPLLHYTAYDLSGLAPTNLFDADLPFTSTLSNIGYVNSVYQSWGGNNGQQNSFAYDLRVKDPSITRSSDWDFPLNPGPDLTWIGRVHRGTPWQTIYLKSPWISPYDWIAWAGVWKYPLSYQNVFDLSRMLPTNDWSIASTLVSLLNTNDPRTVLSINAPDTGSWTSALDGMAVITNTDVRSFDVLTMSSNSSQAATIASAIATVRATQPNGVFNQVDDILAVPDLSVASPWLNTALSPSGQPPPIPDAAYEAIPSQLLPKLRQDSIASVLQTNGAVQFTFTGFDGYSYAVQASMDLRNWVSVSTNVPVNGSFIFTDAAASTVLQRFYRSVLLP